MNFSEFWPVVVACTCYSATMEIELGNGVDSTPVEGGNISSISGRVV